MPKITDISLILHGSTLVFFILLIAGLITIIFMYRRTTPPAKTWRRVVLAVVRVGAVVGIVALLFTPLLTLSIEQHKKPVIALLVDTSSSMNITDKTTNRREGVLDLLGSAGFDNISNDFDIKYYAFNRAAVEFNQENIDSLAFDGEGTDIASAVALAMEQAQDYSLRNIILVSDGIYNLGENPVRATESLGIPVMSIGVGDATPQRDVLISNIQANEIAYTGSTIPVTVSIRSSGYSDTPAAVVLTSDGITLDSQVIQLPENNRERSVTFNFTPAEAKVYKLQVEVSSQENEITTTNNRREFFVKVLESKINILIAAGRPNQDYAFLKRSLESSENFSVTGIVQNPGGYYYGAINEIMSRLEAFHLFILVDFPGSAYQDNLTQAIRQEIIANKKPVMYIRGKSLSAEHMVHFMDIVSIKSFAKMGIEEEVYLQLTQSAFEHPVFRISDDPNENAALWKKLPPVFTADAVPVPADTAGIMGRIDAPNTWGTIRTDFAGNTPLIFLSRTDERKSLFVNVYNLWRWRLMALRDIDITGLYDTLMENCVRWLVNKEDSKLFRIATNKEFYQNGEQVVINAQVYTENYDPVENAEVQVTIQKSGITINRVLQSFGDGRYTTTLEILEPGEYTINGEALQGNRLLGKDTGEFAIGEYSIEMLKTTMDSTLLAHIAFVSGGRYFNLQEAEALPAELDPSPEIVYKKIDIEIWNKAWLLCAIILLLCLEWFIRKRLGML